MATSDEMARSRREMDVMDRVMEAKAGTFLPRTSFLARWACRIRQLESDVRVDPPNSLAANDVPLVHTGYARYRVGLLRTSVDIYELSPTRIANERSSTRCIAWPSARQVAAIDSRWFTSGR
jgi:hypothetical protein